MKDVIIFDTNAIRNPGLNHFLGGRELLRKLQPDADFQIPELVIDELKQQKKRSFERSKKQLLKNDLVQHFSPDIALIESLDINGYIEELQSNESFEFSIIPCVQGELVDQFRAMAILNQAPFNEDSDKGFKDACIYVSVLKHLESLEGRTVFFWGQDGRLKDAFEANPAVEVIKDEDAYHRKSSRFLLDDYFFRVLSTELETGITAEDIGQTWRNIADNWVIQVTKEGRTHLVEIDNREIVGSVEEEDLDGKVEELTSSGSFRQTHTAVAELISLVNFLSPQHIDSINQAGEENTQVGSIATDDDVNELFEAINP